MLAFVIVICSLSDALLFSLLNLKVFDFQYTELFTKETLVIYSVSIANLSLNFKI